MKREISGLAILIPKNHDTTLKSLSSTGTAANWMVVLYARLCKSFFLSLHSLFAVIDKYYQGIGSARLSASDNTGYKWAFAKKLDQLELDAVRDNVDTATDAGASKGKRRNVGPALPSASYSGSSQYDQAGTHKI